MTENTEKLNIGERVITSISMPVEQLEALDLLSLCNEESRSSMISRMISDRANIDYSIQKIAERLVSNFCKSDVDFEKYLKSASAWLTEKKITSYYSERILNTARKIHEA